MMLPLLLLGMYLVTKVPLKKRGLQSLIVRDIEKYLQS
jgi:hypothetical protein